MHLITLACIMYIYISEQLTESFPQSVHASIWSSDFYDLRTFENGLCHTYNPPEKSPSDFLSRLYLMLEPGWENYYNSWDVFIHEKGQFWPRPGLISFGQSEVVTVTSREELEITFAVRELENIKRPGRDCVVEEEEEEEEEHSLTLCLKNYIRSQLSCEIHWFQAEADSQCSPDSLQRYFHFLINLKQAPISEIVAQSGCKPRCKMTQYSLHTRRKRIDWAANWTASVFLQPRSAVVELSTEYYSYDLTELIGDVGGYLGLFLGWSVLTLLDALPFILNLPLSRVKYSRRKKN